MSEHIMEFDELTAAMFQSYIGEEIVRCRDCKRYDPNAPSINSCRFELEGYVEWRSAAPDGFCAWGERKEVGE